MATDVASRGIHVNNVAHVINYDLPQIPEDFIHRVGRTGTNGLGGRASTLVSGAEIAELRSMERALKLKIARKRVHRGPYRDTTSPKQPLNTDAVPHGGKCSRRKMPAEREQTEWFALRVPDEQNLQRFAEQLEKADPSPTRVGEG